MTEIAVEDCGDELDALVRRVERGETVVVTRSGEPVLDLVARPARALAKRRGIDLEAGRRYLLEKGFPDPFPYVAEDFDDPLPEDFLLRPLP